MAGKWLIDPTDLVIDKPAATAIDTALATTSVTLATSASGATTGPAGATSNTPSGLGDITVASPLSWSSASTLTLNAYHAVLIDAPITVKGAGKLVLSYDTSSLQNLLFAPTANVDYGNVNHGGALTINGNAYKLVYSASGLQQINSYSSQGIIAGNYALATSLDAAGTTYSAALIAYNAPGSTRFFAGTFEGLGNTISNLTIAGSTGYSYGLFGNVAASGVVRDIALVNANVTDQFPPQNKYYDVGALAGLNEGTIANASASGIIVGAGFAAQNQVGGLVGNNNYQATLDNVHTSTTVSGGYAGGVAGLNVGNISASYATGSVSGGEDAGGLVGQNGGTISASYATGNVTSRYYGGGLVGLNMSGNIADSYATGAVSSLGSPMARRVGWSAQISTVTSPTVMPPGRWQAATSPL